MKITSPSWWFSMLTSTFMTMLFIYIIKWAAGKVNVPVVSDVVQSV